MRELIPFPYKLSSADSINDGLVYTVPKFCDNNCNNPKCKQFYKTLLAPGEYVCPFGFGVVVLDINGHHLILTSLNVEKLTQRKEVQKRLSDKDFSPRLRYEKYKNSINSISEALNSRGNDENYNTELARAAILTRQELLEDTIHEIRKLNAQLKSASTKLSQSLANMRSKNEHIENLNLDILSITNLLSIRLDAYDLEVNPSLNLNSGKRDIAIYKKIEKVYKCLKDEAYKKGLSIKLQGSSHCSYYANNNIEIAFFILIDNAIKYSPKGKEIQISFFEDEDKLIVDFQNLGVCPKNDEKNKIFDREFRSENVENINGRGIGLYLLKQICNSNSIEVEHKIGSDWFFDENQIRYSTFAIKLIFNNITRQDEI